MASILLLLCVSCFALAAAWSAAPAPAPYALEDAELHFERFIQKYERNYADENEKQTRFQIFKENLQNINSLNEDNKHAVFDITQFSDLSQEEFKSKITCLRTGDTNSLEDACTYIYDKDIVCNDAPESFDWREHGAVTPVKVQMNCGSCYAFSAFGSLEGQYAIKHKELVELSAQQIIDCDKEDFGCNGIQGIGLFYYKEGIISDENCNIGDINHGVLLVRYGSEAGVPFWIVKNSWDTSYGEDGYFRMRRGEDALFCGMMNDLMASAIVA